MGIFGRNRYYNKMCISNNVITFFDKRNCFETTCIWNQSPLSMSMCLMLIVNNFQCVFNTAKITVTDHGHKHSKTFTKHQNVISCENLCQLEDCFRFGYWELDFSVCHRFLENPSAWQMFFITQLRNVESFPRIHCCKIKPT